MIKICNSGYAQKKSLLGLDFFGDKLFHLNKNIYCKGRILPMKCEHLFLLMIKVKLVKEFPLLENTKLAHGTQQCPRVAS